MLCNYYDVLIYRKNLLYILGIPLLFRLLCFHVFSVFRIICFISKTVKVFNTELEPSLILNYQLCKINHFISWVGEGQYAAEIALNK